MFLPSVDILHGAAPALFSHQDKSAADAMVKDYENRQYSLESSLLEGFSACNYRAAAAVVAATWALEIDVKVIGPEQLPSDRVCSRPD